MEDRNLFYTIMEADGDLLEPFQPTEEPAAPEPVEQQGQETNEQPPADMGADAPPESTDMEELSFDETGGDEGDVGTTDDQNQEDEQESVSKQANDILNQRLYQQLLDRNSEIEELLESIQEIIPLLPYDLVIQNDKSINRLRKALTNGQEYALHKFVNLSYGENLLYYQKLDSLYTLLQNAIDSVLKKFQKDSE